MGNVVIFAEQARDAYVGGKHSQFNGWMSKILVWGGKFSQLVGLANKMLMGVENAIISMDR